MASRALATLRCLCHASSPGSSVWRSGVVPHAHGAAIQPRLRPAPVQLSGPALQQTIRAYASKKKSGKKGGKQRSNDDSDDAPPGDPVDMDALEKRMQTHVDWFAAELRTLRAGRASPGILDNVRVQLRGGSAGLSELAMVAVRDAQNLLVIPNSEGELTAIENAIRSAGLGLNPRQEKSTVVVPVPKATKESREKLVKSLGTMAEQLRVHIRRDRQDAMKHVKGAAKAGMPKDEARAWEKDIQAATDKHTGRIEELLKAKSREIERT